MTVVLGVSGGGWCLAPGQRPRAAVGVQAAISPWVLLPGHSHAERVADGLIRAEDKPRAAVWSCRYVPSFTINTQVKAAAKKQWGHTHPQEKSENNGALQAEQRIHAPYLRCIFQFHFTIKLEKLPQHFGECYPGKDPYYVFPRDQILGCPHRVP